MSHSTHTRQVPFGDGKEVDREVQRGIRPATPASAAHKDQTALLVGSPIMVICTLTIPLYILGVCVTGASAEYTD